MKYIRKNHGQYQIQKKWNNKMHYFGCYQTLEDAQKVRDVLVSVNFGRSKNPMRNITKTPSNTYQIRKSSDSEYVWIENFKDLKEAQRVRDELESIDWDIDLLDTTSLEGNFKSNFRLPFEKIVDGKRYENYKGLLKRGVCYD